MNSLRDYLLEHSVYPDEEFNRAAEVAIKTLVVPPQNNIFDYYKGSATLERKVWFTSDTHFGHQKDFLYEPRGFASSEEHDAAIIENWNSIIGPDDEVYHLGDVMLGDNEHGIKCLEQLNGRIHILIGNHDTDTRIQLYRQCKNVVSIDYALRKKFGKYHVWLSHYPTITANYDADKPWAKHMVNIYGHTHQQSKFYSDNPYMYCVCLDAHDNKPVSLEQIVEDVKEKKITLDNSIGGQPWFY